jgi:3alpha(or 20beta)-hydroxysteroid dehydrogenase
VVIGDVLDDAGREVAQKLGDAGCFVRLDVTNPDGPMGRCSRCDTDPIPPVRCAGEQRRNRQDRSIARFLGSPLAARHRHQSHRRLLRHAGRRRIHDHRCGGSIVNISSVEGLAGSAHLHAYVAAKFGLRGITKSTTIELAPHGIRVNSIHPGLVLTPMSKGVTEDFMAAIPMCRGAEPERKLHVRGVFGQMSRRTPPERNSSSTVA